MRAADDWNWIHRLHRQTSKGRRNAGEVRELDAFALANAGKPIDAIAKLEALIGQSGPTPERLGLLGGRYKRLSAQASAAKDYDEASRLLNRRSRPMSAAWSLTSTSITARAICRASTKPESALATRARRFRLQNRYRRLRTRQEARLGGRVATSDLARHSLRRRRRRQGRRAGGGHSRGRARAWKLDTTLADLKASVVQVQNKNRRDRLAAMLKRFAPSAKA